MDTPRIDNACTGPLLQAVQPRPAPFRPASRPARANARHAMVALAGGWLLAGCASSGIDAQWVDPQLGKRSLAGTKVFVVCQAVDLSVRLVCGDQMAAQLKALGALPLLQPPTADAGSALVATLATPELERANAHAAGAAVLFSARIAPESVAVSSGPSFSIGIGGFGGSGRSGGGVGLGVAAPIGGAGSPSTGYSASGSLIDVPSGRLIWSAKASAAPASDVNEQLATLAKTLLEAARNAGLFPR